MEKVLTNQNQSRRHILYYYYRKNFKNSSRNLKTIVQFQVQCPTYDEHHRFRHFPPPNTTCYHYHLFSIMFLNSLFISVLILRTSYHLSKTRNLRKAGLVPVSNQFCSIKKYFSFFFPIAFCVKQRFSR